MNKTFISIATVLIILFGVLWFSKKPAIVPAESVSPTPAANITIISPTTNELVDSPILVTGKAKVFENQLTVQVKDSRGTVIAIAHIFTDAKDAGQFGNYSVKIPVPVGATKNLKVEALSYSPKGDGSFEGYAAVPVELKTTETMTVMVALNTDTSNCSQVTLFPRSIIKTPQVAYMSLVELLKGPSDIEKSKGAFAAIPPDTQLLSLKIEKGTAYVDLDSALNNHVGLCHDQGIIAILTNTLKQFGSVDNVVISGNGVKFVPEP